MRTLLVLLSLLAAPVALVTGVPPAAAYEDEDETTRDQINLVWVSGYQGPLSGRMGPRAREAVSRFQASLGSTRSGYLTDYDRDALESQAAVEKQRLGWTMRLDAPTGMRIGLPEKFLGSITRKGSGTEYKGTRGAFLMQTMVTEVEGPTALRDQLTVIYAALKREGYTVTYSTMKDDWFVVNASQSSSRTDVYVRTHEVGRWVKGYMLFTPQVGSPIGAMVPAVSLSLAADAEEPQIKSAPPQAVAAVEPRAVPTTPVAVSPPRASVQPPASKQGTGSGFVVASGKVLTNFHVIDGCSSVLVAGGGIATVAAKDEKNDLALLDTPSVTGRPLALAPEATRLGEDVVVMGYPLGDMLGNRLNITQGIVSSTEGFQGDWTNLQIAVPVQMGNSGGPLLDLEGRVRGVVVAKLKSRMLASGDAFVPEQVNFAIKGEVAKGFLKGNGVTMLEPASTGKEGRKSTADIADGARASVVQILCR